MQKLIRNEIFVLFVLCLVSSSFLIYAITNLSISYYEAEIFYHDRGLTGIIARLSCEIFGQNDFALRLPFLGIYLANVILMYKISKFFLKRRFDRVIATMLFMSLPAVLTSAILVNIAGIIIFITLLAIYFWNRGDKMLFYATLLVAFLIDKNFIFLYATLLMYAYFRRNLPLALFCAALLVLDIYIFDYEIYGKPRGYFPDTVGVFAGAFSPLVFLFFIYMSYRTLIKEPHKNMLYFISVGTFFIALVLSFRQRLHLEDFLPYCVISAPLIIRSFLNSYRIRLPQFRKFHKFSAILTISVLVLVSITIIFNQYLYSSVFANAPHKHFAYKYDIAKDLSTKLKNRNIKAINSEPKTALRLKFYGIENSGEMFLKENCDKMPIKIQIFKGEILASSWCIF